MDNNDDENIGDNDENYSDNNNNNVEMMIMKITMIYVQVQDDHYMILY